MAAIITQVQTKNYQNQLIWHYKVTVPRNYAVDTFSYAKIVLCHRGWGGPMPGSHCVDGNSIL